MEANNISLLRDLVVRAFACETW